MRASRVVVTPFALLFSMAVAATTHADGYFTFADLPLQGDRTVIGSTYDSQAGVVFTVLPHGDGTPGELGLVRANALWYCIHPFDTQTMLGTAQAGHGDIGEGFFQIRVDFATPLVPPAIVHVQVQTTYDYTVLVTLYDADGNIVGFTSPGASNLRTGHCGPGDPNFPKYMNGIFGAWSASPIVYAIVWVEAPFTIESVGWMERVVPVEPVTWGRVKALYDGDRPR